MDCFHGETLLREEEIVALTPELRSKSMKFWLLKNELSTKKPLWMSNFRVVLKLITGCREFDT
jgi:hypothetical protein